MHCSKVCTAGRALPSHRGVLKVDALLMYMHSGARALLLQWCTTPPGSALRSVLLVSFCDVSMRGEGSGGARPALLAEALQAAQTLQHARRTRLLPSELTRLDHLLRVGALCWIDGGTVDVQEDLRQHRGPAETQRLVRIYS